VATEKCIDAFLQQPIRFCHSHFGKHFWMAASRWQGCQMVDFHTKNANIGIFCNTLGWNFLCISWGFYCHFGTV
jgi:hypothetical protein